MLLQRVLRIQRYSKNRHIYNVFTYFMNYLNSMSLLAISTGLLGFVHQQYDDGNLTSELPRRAFKTTRLSDGLPIHHLRVEGFKVFQSDVLFILAGNCSNDLAYSQRISCRFFVVFTTDTHQIATFVKPSLVQQSFNITNFV